MKIDKATYGTYAVWYPQRGYGVSYNSTTTLHSKQAFDNYEKVRKKIDDAEKEQELLAFNMGYRCNNIGR